LSNLLTPGCAPRVPVYKDSIRELPDDEARARGLEAVADTDAYSSIAYVYCGLYGCTSRPPNQADLDKGRRLWAIAISKWKLAMNTTHDDKLRDRLLEKTRPAHGVSCDEKTCEPTSPMTIAPQG